MDYVTPREKIEVGDVPMTGGMTPTSGALTSEGPTSEEPTSGAPTSGASTSGTPSKEAPGE